MFRGTFYGLAFFVLALPVVRAQEQDPEQRQGRALVGLGTIRVNVRNATGAPLSTHAVVRITQRVGSINMTAGTMDATSAEFRNLPVGDYIIEVSAPGFLPATEEATLFSANSVAQVYVHLRPETAPGATMASGPPVLAPKAEKEVQEARRALEKKDLVEAEQHLARAEKLAPGHPEVQYLFGILSMRRNDVAKARQRFERALTLYPQHTGALIALGRLLLSQGDLPGAAGALERALVVDGRSQQGHSLLAAIFLQEKQLDKARYHAEQALDISGGKQPEPQLLLAQVLAAQGDRKQAADLLEKVVVEHPEHPDAEGAKRLMYELRLGKAAPAGGSSTAPAGNGGGGSAESASAPGGGAQQGGQRVTQAGARVLALATLSAELAPGAAAPAAVEWAPKDVDQVPVATFRDVPCSEKQVLAQAGRRVEDMVIHLRDVNAAEEVIHTFVDALGHPGRSESAKYEYMFSIQRPKPGLLWVDEYRNGGSEMVGGIATTGLAAMALIFHPHYAGDFEMRCEGQGNWKGEPVWFVYFKQREDKLSRIRAYRYRSGSVRVALKGRAWIAANTYQIVRLETDLVAPVPDVKLEREHLVVEYGPVNFKERKGTFWLPSFADVYAHERGKRWHRRHTLTNYVHFAVDTKQKIADPKGEGGDRDSDSSKKPPA